MNIFRRRPDDIETATQEWAAARDASHRISQNIGKIAASTKLETYFQHTPYVDEVIHVSLMIPPDPNHIPFDQDAHEHTYDTVVYLEAHRSQA